MHSNEVSDQIISREMAIEVHSSQGRASIRLLFCSNLYVQYNRNHPNDKWPIVVVGIAAEKVSIKLY